MHYEGWQAENSSLEVVKGMLSTNLERWCATKKLFKTDKPISVHVVLDNGVEETNQLVQKAVDLRDEMMTIEEKEDSTTVSDKAWKLSNSIKHLTLTLEGLARMYNEEMKETNKKG